MSVETYAPDTLFAGSTPSPLTGKALIKAGVGALVRGTVLAKILKSIAAAVAAETNTGNGTVTGEALGAGVQAGTYTLTCNGGELQATAGECQGVGDGTLTLDETTPVLTGAVAGVYQVLCVTAFNADPAVAAKFIVLSPAGRILGHYTVGGTAFATQIKFAITEDETNKHALGDYYLVTVAQAVPDSGIATFDVTDPNGVSIGTATVGQAFSGEIGFTINAGATNFELGDEFTIEVSAIAPEDALFTTVNSAAHDGSENPCGSILAQATDASVLAAGNKLAMTYETGCFNENALVFGGNDTADTHRGALRALGIFLRTVQAS